MKGVKGKLLKKMKSIRPLGALKQTRILQISALNSFLDPSSVVQDSNHHQQNSSICRDPKSVHFNTPVKNELNVVDITELMKDLEEDEEDMEIRNNREEDKENIGPLRKAKDPPLVLDKEKLKNPILSESGFRRPDLNSPTLFDPNLLEAFEQARMEHVRALEAVRESRIEEKKIEEEEEPPSNSPPGGSDTVIFYTTSLRGIRKTFEDCQSIRFLLNSFRILFYERDVSMHLEFREEMWRTLGDRVVPPRLFIKGRYIGGADEVVGLHEQGKLLKLLEGLPRDQSTCPCECCGGERFIVCYNCNGGRKINCDEGKDVSSVKCPQCNENGLIVCPMCC